MARIAKSLDTLRSQINAAYPGRKKGSDGWIGNLRHSRTTSEHNPDSNGVVRALDITNDPKNGVYARQIAESIVRSRDPRVLYIISNGQIVRNYARSGTTPWRWSPYSGPNPHIEHFHTSVVETKSLYDSVALWSLPKAAAPIVDLPHVNERITATMFNDTRLAYSDVPKGHLQRYGVALPYSFPSPRPKIKIWRAGEPDTAVIADIIDKGPWHTSDPYWLTNRRPEAESGVMKTGINAGKKTNKAGIDLTPPLDKKLKLGGKGLVDWEFVQ